MEVPRTPMDNLFNVISGFSAGHEKALRQGIYNAVAISLLCLVCTAGWGLYIILNPFVKPLIWALLCGSALFPFKLYLTNAVQSWFDTTEHSPQPLLVNLTMIPVRIFDRLSDTLGSLLRENLKTIILLLAGVGGAFAVYSYTPSFLNCLMWRLVQLLGAFISLFITACNVYTVNERIQNLDIQGFSLMHFFFSNCSLRTIDNKNSCLIE